jgi:hypothetical protein
VKALTSSFPRRGPYGLFPATTLCWTKKGAKAAQEAAYAPLGDMDAAELERRILSAKDAFLFSNLTKDTNPLENAISPS